MYLYIIEKCKCVFKQWDLSPSFLVFAWFHHRSAFIDKPSMIIVSMYHSEFSFLQLRSTHRSL